MTYSGGLSSGLGFSGYRVWKRSRACSPSAFSAASHVGQSYTDHFTRYWSFFHRLCSRESRILSTWYSSSPSTTTGVGRLARCPENESLAGCSRRDMRKKECICIYFGKARRTAYGVLRRSSTKALNGPRWWWSSFREGRQVVMFLALSHTQSLERKWGWVEGRWPWNPKVQQNSGRW